MSNDAGIDSRIDSGIASLIDFHCDTAYELYRRKETLSDNTCHISLPAVKSAFSRYAQFFAIWTDKNLNDEEGFAAYREIYRNFCRLAQTEPIALCRTGNDLDAAWASGKVAAFLAVEDARLLAGDLDRLDLLWQMGVRYLTLTWGKSSSVGGAHDTEDGLTPFGVEVVKRCMELGILPDISHASRKCADEILHLAAAHDSPVIASHSNAAAIYPHSRNLSDEQFLAVRDAGGIVGINFCIYHIGNAREKEITVDDLLPHIEHFLSLGGENTLVFGCDRDGTDLPRGLETFSSLTVLRERLAGLGYSRELIEKLFWKNACDFLHRALI